VLTPAVLSDVFGVAVNVHRHGDTYTATSDTVDF
jgi:hypothetical protein